MPGKCFTNLNNAHYNCFCLRALYVLRINVYEIFILEEARILTKISIINSNRHCLPMNYDIDNASIVRPSFWFSFRVDERPHANQFSEMFVGNGKT